MTKTFQTTVRRESSCAVVYTDGYINDKGGEKIYEECYKLLGLGTKRLILNLAKSPIVNSLGISALIKLIENFRFEGGRIVFCNCTPHISRTFEVMGLTRFTEIYGDEKAAVSALTS